MPFQFFLLAEPFNHREKCPLMTLIIISSLPFVTSLFSALCARLIKLNGIFASLQFFHWIWFPFWLEKRRFSCQEKQLLLAKCNRDFGRCNISKFRLFWVLFVRLKSSKISDENFPVKSSLASFFTLHNNPRELNRLRL